MKKIVTRFYSEIVENDLRRMILKTLIAESDRFEQLAKFYHKEILVPARKMLENIVRNGIKRGEFRDTPIVNFDLTPVNSTSVYERIHPG